MKSIKPSEWHLAQKKIKSWIRKSNVSDVVVFGSFVRAKTLPGDIDLCIIINEQDEPKSIDLVGSLSEELEDIPLKFQINILTEKSFFSGNSLASTLLSEGISISGEPLAERLGYSAASLFLYSLKGFNASKRVRFHYLLAGRGKDGVLKDTDGKILGDGVLLVPTGKEDAISEVFKMWDVHFTIRRVLMVR